ncbi:hypothetical protein ACOMHN_027595 [Nucella lapillus]
MATQRRRPHTSSPGHTEQTTTYIVPWPRRADHPIHRPLATQSRPPHTSSTGHTEQTTTYIVPWPHRADHHIHRPLATQSIWLSR